MENRKSHSLLVEIKNGTDTFAVSYKAKNSLNIIPPHYPIIVLPGTNKTDLKNSTQKPVHKQLHQLSS